MEEIILRVTDLPYGIKACVTQDEEGDYNVYVNARYNQIQRECAVLHELGHIITHDFSNGLPLEIIEK